jgi:hypothetical protein
MHAQALVKITLTVHKRKSVKETVRHICNYVIKFLKDLTFPVRLSPEFFLSSSVQGHTLNCMVQRERGQNWRGERGELFIGGSFTYKWKFSFFLVYLPVRCREQYIKGTQERENSDVYLPKSSLRRPQG